MVRQSIPTLFLLSSLPLCFSLPSRQSSSSAKAAPKLLMKQLTARQQQVNINVNAGAPGEWRTAEYDSTYSQNWNYLQGYTNFAGEPTFLDGDGDDEVLPEVVEKRNLGDAHSSRFTSRHHQAHLRRDASNVAKTRPLATHHHHSEAHKPTKIQVNELHKVKPTPPPPGTTSLSRNRKASRRKSRAGQPKSTSAPRDPLDKQGRKKANALLVEKVKEGQEAEAKLAAAKKEAQELHAVKEGKTADAEKVGRLIGRGLPQNSMSSQGTPGYINIATPFFNTALAKSIGGLSYTADPHNSSNFIIGTSTECSTFWLSPVAMQPEESDTVVQLTVPMLDSKSQEMSTLCATFAVEPPSSMSLEACMGEPSATQSQFFSYNTTDGSLTPYDSAPAADTPSALNAVNTTSSSASSTSSSSGVFASSTTSLSSTSSSSSATAIPSILQAINVLNAHPVAKFKADKEVQQPPISNEDAATQQPAVKLYFIAASAYMKNQENVTPASSSISAFSSSGSSSSLPSSVSSATTVAISASSTSSSPVSSVTVSSMVASISWSSTSSASIASATPSAGGYYVSAVKNFRESPSSSQEKKGRRRRRRG